VLFSDAMQNMHAVGQAQMTNLPVFNMPGSYNLFKPVKVPFMFERPTASFVFGTLSEKDQEIMLFKSRLARNLDSHKLTSC